MHINEKKYSQNVTKF